VIRRLERDRLTSDLADTEELLSTLSPDDVLGRMSLSARRNQLTEQLAAAPRSDEPSARTALFFGGSPVIGGQGIDADFAGKALSQYDDLLTKVWASAKHGPLPRSGPVPAKQEARLHITGTVVGSFGFELTELEESNRGDLFPLREAVEQTTQAIIAAAESDDALADVAERLDSRAFAALRDFFGHLKKSHATLRVVSERDDKALSFDAVFAAAERTEASQIQETNETVRGTFAAVLPDSRRFEFRTQEGKLLQGRVADEVSASELREMNRKFVDKACIAELHVVSLSRSGKSRARYKLLSLRDE